MRGSPLTMLVTSLDLCSVPTGVVKDSFNKPNCY